MAGTGDAWRRRLRVYERGGGQRVLGGVAAADGYGGWGHSAGAKDKSGGLKYPPSQPKKVEDDEKTLV